MNFNFSKDKIYNFIATFFWAGSISPVAPGTVGSIAASIVALPFCWFSSNNGATFLILSIVTFAVGVYCSQKIYEVTNNKDPQYVVIDEAAGIFFTIFLVSIFTKITFGKVLFSLISFRIFDIWKPYPIRDIEKTVSDNHQLVGFSIMVDDIVAAVYAACLVILFR